MLLVGVLFGYFRSCCLHNIIMMDIVCAAFLKGRSSAEKCRRFVIYGKRSLRKCRSFIFLSRRSS